jgi:hypothetical protein
MRRKGFTISKLRGMMYREAKYLGDAQAIQKSIATGSAAPIAKRLARRAVGSLFATIMRGLFR